MGRSPTCGECALQPSLTSSGAERARPSARARTSRSASAVHGRSLGFGGTTSISPGLAPGRANADSKRPIGSSEARVEDSCTRGASHSSYGSTITSPLRAVAQTCEEFRSRARARATARTEQRTGTSGHTGSTQQRTAEALLELAQLVGGGRGLGLELDLLGHSAAIRPLSERVGPIYSGRCGLSSMQRATSRAEPRGPSMRGKLGTRSTEQLIALQAADATVGVKGLCHCSDRHASACVKRDTRYADGHTHTRVSARMRAQARERTHARTSARARACTHSAELARRSGPAAATATEQSKRARECCHGARGRGRCGPMVGRRGPRAPAVSAHCGPCSACVALLPRVP